jgi:NADPH-dependent curcumin reductase
LVSRPGGFPKESDFEMVELPVSEPSEGEVLTRTLYLSIDPYMRGRMSDAKSYSAPVPIGGVMVGRTIGEVVASRDLGFAAGDIVLGFGNWQDYATLRGKTLRKLDPALAPVTTALGVLGMPGHTICWSARYRPTTAWRDRGRLGCLRRSRFAGWPDRQNQRLPRRRHCWR